MRDFKPQVPGIDLALSSLAVWFELREEKSMPRSGKEIRVARLLWLFFWSEVVFTTLFYL